MHILFLTHNYPPEVNAAASRVSERAKYWIAAGHEVTVITCNPHFPQGKLHGGYKNRWYQVEEIDGVRVVRVKTLIAGNKGVIKRTLSFVVYMKMAVLAGLFQKKPDVIISTSPQFFAAVGGWFLSVLKAKPFIFELGDIWPASLSAVGVMKKSFLLSMVEKLELFLYRRSAKVVALTDSFKANLVSRGIDADKIKVVLNGVEINRYSPRAKDASLITQYGLQDNFVIGYLGTHGMAHALENIIYAAKLLQDSKIKFMFVGDGAARENLIKLADEERVKNILFIPAQPKERIADFWSVCDVALVHLKNEAVFQEVIPSKIFEAMGMGLPILLAAPFGDASQLIEKEGAGMVVPAEQPESLAKSALYLCEHADERNEFAIKSAQAAKKYSREKQAFDMLNLINHVVLGDK